MKLILNNKCFLDIFILFFLIIFSIPLQLQAINFHLLYYFDSNFFFQKLFFVFILTIFFTFLFYKIHSRIDYLFDFFFLYLISVGLFIPIGGTFDLFIKEKINLNLYITTIIKLLVLIYLTYKIKNFPNTLNFLRVFVFVYSIIILSNVIINQQKYTFKNFNEVYNFSKKENLVVLSFDGISNENFLNELINSEEKEFFKDFTFYKNAHSNATGTWISTNLEIFGHIPFNEKISTQSKHLSKMYTHSNEIKNLKKVKIDVYGNYNRNFKGEINRYNYSVFEDSISRSFYYYFNEIILSSFNRYFSSYFVKLKNYLFKMNFLVKFQKQKKLYSLNNESYNDLIKLNNNLKVDNQSDHISIKFFHFEFTHSPIKFDKNCTNMFHDKNWELKELKLKDKEISECVVKLSRNFIKKLKEKNLYDNTTIIIKSDHGRQKNFYSDAPYNLTINNNRYFSYGRYKPILLIKNKNQIMNNLKVSKDQVFLSDLNNIYCKNKIVECSKSNGYDFSNGKFLEKKLVEVFLPLKENSYVNIYENKKILFDRTNEFYQFLYDL